MKNHSLIIALNDAKLDVHVGNFQDQRTTLAAVLRNAGRPVLADRLAETSNVQDFREACAAVASLLYAEDTPQERTGSPVAAAIPTIDTGRAAVAGRPLTEKQADALTEFLDNIGAYTLADIGPHLTCGEADTIANLFRAFGYDGDADALIEGHAEEDEEGDAHYVEPEWEPGRCRQTGRITGYQCGAPAEEGSVYCSTHAHLAADDEPRCHGCGRVESACSLDPCADVLADRAATV